MEDRFKFNAIVSSYYDIETSDNYEEFEPTFYLRNVDVFVTDEIGIYYDVLFDTVKNQAKDLTDKEIGQIMQHFEDNSNSPECEYVTIRPDKIIQSTGLKDKNGKLIYEGDIVEAPSPYELPYVGIIEFGKTDYKNAYGYLAIYIKWIEDKYKVVRNDILFWVENKNALEVIGNIYEDSHLIENSNNLC